MTGTLTADPELRFTASGVAVANFTVAANDRRFNKETNTWEDAGATFLRATVWREFAEHVAESLSKGQRVIVTGTLKQRSWETDQGDTRYAYEVDAIEVGPSLKWATADVKKATRTGGKGLSGDTDPWTTATPAASSTPPAMSGAPTPAGAGGFSDEPPF
jgi:single-strand DNA-binding protein